MDYIVKMKDGKEYGPVDQSIVLQWIESGRITPDCEIKNSMMNTWQSIQSVSFVQDLTFQKPEVEEKKTQKARVHDAVYSLNTPGIFKYVGASPLKRFFAWSMDMFLILIPTLFALPLIHIVLTDPAIQKTSTIALVIIEMFIYFFYYTICYGFAAQTVGQWFWGAMIVRADGDPVYTLRAFIYTLISFPLLPTTLLFTIIMPKNRALQDFAVGVRIINITLKS
ncbi:MAG: RDD family protein [Lentisphaeria bacterium]|nr:RDD family protein [Lentisphaeria bacterium]NQZ66835.1 RDD family protein [Lentisphaeria bacterium]